jgi:hypothetical protein
MKLGTAIGVLAVVWNGIAILACLFLPETRNQDLALLDSVQKPSDDVAKLRKEKGFEATK